MRNCDKLRQDKCFEYYPFFFTFVRDEFSHKYNAMELKDFPLSLADKVLNDPDFRDDFLSMSALVDTVKIWLSSHGRHKDEYSVLETCKTAYEIIRWNAGLPEKDPRKKDLSNLKFWSSLNSLLNTYADKWLSEEEGRSYQQALLNLQYAKDIPQKVDWKIRNFCDARRAWLGLAKNDALVDDMCQQVYSLLYADNKKVIKSLKFPGTLWTFLKRIIDNLFSNKFPKLTFTESFVRMAKKKDEKESYSYAHLSFSSWYPSELEHIMLGEGLYPQRVAPRLRALIEQFYKPWEEDSPGGDIADFNTTIKEELGKMFDSIREERSKKEESFPLKNDDISLSYNCTYAESYVLTTDNTPALRDLLTPGDELPTPINPTPSDGPELSPAPSSNLGYSPLSNTEALAILDEVFGLQDSEEIRVYRIASLFNTRLYKGRQDAELSKKYAYKLEDLKVFESNCERGSKNYMVNHTKANDKTEKRFVKGAKMAIAQKRVSDEDVIKMIRFFRNCDFIDFYNKERNTHYENI